MPGSLRIGKIGDVDIYAHVSWLIVLVLLTWSLAVDWYPQNFAGWSGSLYWGIAFVSALLFLVCVLIHELMHAWVVKTCGLRMLRTTLFMFGGVAQYKGKIKSPRAATWVALAGPMSNLLLSGLCTLCAFLFLSVSSPVEAVFCYLAILNGVLCLLNFLPALPLDGGRLLLAIYWRDGGSTQRAARHVSAISQGIAYLLIVLGIVLCFTSTFIDGLWIVSVGWFVLSSNQSTHLQTVIEMVHEDVVVADVMEPCVCSIAARLPLQKLVDEYFLPQGLYSALVVSGDMLVGLITLKDIGKIERECWGYTPVGYVMRLVEQIEIAAPSQALDDVLQVMIARSISQVPVVDEGRLVGVLSHETILRYIQKRQRQREESTQEWQYVA